MKKTIITVFCVLIGLGVLGKLIEDKDGAAPEARRSAPTAEATRPPTPAEVVSPQALFDAFEQNEVAADDRYKGKWIEISGTIDNIGKDILDKMYLTLEAEQPLFGVQAFFADKHKSALASLAKGDPVTLLCKCSGKMGNVLLRECSFK